MLAEDESRAASTEGAENTDFGLLGNWSVQITGRGIIITTVAQLEGCCSNTRVGAEDASTVSIVTSCNLLLHGWIIVNYHAPISPAWNSPALPQGREKVLLPTQCPVPRSLWLNIK